MRPYHVLLWLASLHEASAISEPGSRRNDQVPLGYSNHHYSQASRPNIVLILTDDQDLHLNSLAYTPHVQRHLIDHGTFFKRHFCSTALCCPSRVTLFTGKLSHNHNVTNVVPPYGTKLQAKALPMDYEIRLI